MSVLRDVRCALLCLAFLATAPVQAAGGAGAGDPVADAYCRYVTERAHAESARLLVPAATAGFGLVHGTEALIGQGLADALLPRAAVGLRYDLAEVRRGLLTLRLGEAECDRHRAERQLRARSARAVPDAERRGWAAKAAVLEQALPQALEIVSNVERLVGGGEAMLTDLSATAVRVEALRAQLADARLEQEARAATAGPPPDGLDAAAEAWAQAEARVASLDGRIRASRAWEVTLRGGWEQVYRTDGLRPADSRIPFYGLVSIAISPGLLWQGRADERAAEARRAWAAAGGDEASEALTLQRARLVATLRHDRQRRTEVHRHLEELQGYLREVERAGGGRAARIREALWFEDVRARADAAFLDARAEGLAALLGEPGGER